MKKNIFLIISVFGTMIQSYSQSLLNGSFQNYCGIIIYVGGCPTFDINCAPNWGRSHGTPQILISPGPKVNVNYLYMWSQSSGSGEGVFTPYNFKKNNPYLVAFRTVTGNATRGDAFIYAANGLTQSFPIGCGSAVPNPSRQLIAQQSGIPQQGWTDYQYTFVANNNYSQFFAYPLSASPPSQYDLYVDYFTVQPDCNATAFINSGSISSGDNRAGTFYVGSSAGSGGFGTVTIQPSQNTTLIAQNDIHLLTEFQATVTSGNFIAKIQNCYDPGIYGRQENVNAENLKVLPDFSVSRIDSGINAQNQKNADLISDDFLNVYPIPGNKYINIETRMPDLQNVLIIVMDETSKEVYRKMDKFKNGRIKLNLSNLSNGVYFIKVISGGKIFGKTIILN